MKPKLTLVLVFASFTFTALHQAGAVTTVLITDAFSGSNGASLNGRTPDGINVPVQTWGTSGFSNTVLDTGSGNPAPTATGGHNGVATIDVSTAVFGYAKPSDFTISADLRIGAIAGSGTAFGRGVGLGFFNNTGAVEAFTYFTGLRVLPDGTLDLWKDGVAQGVSAAAPAGFNTSTFYNLTYSVDLITGSITNVVYNGTDLTSTFSGVNSVGDFTDPSTKYAGFYASSAAFTGGAGFDNFLLSTQSAIPEPSRAALLLGGQAGMLLRRRRAHAAAR